MEAKDVTRRTKRLLQQSAADRVDHGRAEYSHIRSKRLKTMFRPAVGEGSYRCRSESESTGFFPFLSMLGKCSVMTRGMTSVLEQSAAESNQTGDKCDQVRSRRCKRISCRVWSSIKSMSKCQQPNRYSDADTLPDSNQSNSAQDIESNNMRDRLFSPVSKKASAKLLFSRKVPIKKKKKKKKKAKFISPRFTAMIYYI